MQKEDLIKQYCEIKEEEKEVKKKISALSSDIKSYLNDNKLTEDDNGEWKVQLQHKVSESLDEEKLVGCILQYKNEHPDDIIAYLDYIPVINMEKLESAIYNNEVPDEIIAYIDKCRVKKESDALVYKRVKKEN